MKRHSSEQAGFTLLELVVVVLVVILLILVLIFMKQQS